MKRVVALFAVIAALALASVASGDTFNSGQLWASGGYCIDGISAVQDFGGYGQSYGWVSASQAVPGIGWLPGMGCAWSWDRPPGYMAIGAYWEYWNGTQWVADEWIPYRYNPTTEGDFASTNNGQGLGMAISGPGWYGNMAYLWVYNGGWLGGGLWSGYEWLQ